MGRAVANPVPVILDVDTGIDDALALLLAAKSPALDLLAVSCVSGNAGVDQVVRNTLKVLDAAGATDVSVARGADRPLLEPARDARHVHGEDGMGDLGWPDSERAPVDMHAIELMRLTLESAPRPVTLVPLAPMTNVALLLRAYPHVADNIERIVFMGGAAAIGNATAAAEFNVWHDPEAAGIVLTSGLPVTMYGLDVFYEVTIDEAAAARLVDVVRCGGTARGPTAATPARAAHRDHRGCRRGRCCHRAGGLDHLATPGPDRAGRHVDTRPDPRRPPVLGR